MQRLEPYTGEIHRFVARRVENAADAADIAQQALLQACAKIDSCRGQDVVPWLHAIARHLIVDHYRARRRFQFVEAATLEEREPALRTPREAVPDRYERRQRLAGLMDYIARRLRLEEQVALLLADVHGYRDKESAAVLRMSVPSFKLLLHGARSRLQAVDGGDGMLSPREGGAAQSAPVRRARCLGVTCRLGLSRLVALRSRLMDALKLLGLTCLDALQDLVLLWQDAVWLGL